MCGDEDRGDRAAIGLQLGLEFQSRHARHSDIGDQTTSVVLPARVQEGLRGVEGHDRKTGGAQQALHSRSIRVVIFDHSDHLLGMPRHPNQDRSARCQPAIMSFDKAANRFLQGMPEGFGDRCLNDWGQLQPFRHSSQFSGRVGPHLAHYLTPMNGRGDFGSAQRRSDLLREHA